MKNLMLLFILVHLIHVTKGQNNVNNDLFTVFYKVDNSSPLNAPFFPKHGSLSDGLIAQMKSGHLQTYSEDLLTRISGKTCDENLDKTKNVEGEFYFLFSKEFHFNNTMGKTVYHPKQDYIQLYFKLKKGESIFISSFLAYEMEEAYMPYNYAVEWYNLFNITDVRIYSEAIHNNLFSGKLVKLVHNSTKKVEVIPSKKYWETTYSIFNTTIDYSIDFNYTKSKLSQSETIYENNNCDSVYFTRFFLELGNQTKINTLWKGVSNAVTKHKLLVFNNGILRKRMSLETFIKKRNEAEALPKEAIGAYFNMPSQLIRSSNKLIFAKSGKYILRNSCQTEYEGFNPAGLTFYIKPNYSKSGKIELLATFAVMEIVENLSKANSDQHHIAVLFKEGDFEIEHITYLNLFTAEKHSLKSKKNINLLKSMMGDNAEALDPILSKKNLIDF